MKFSVKSRIKIYVMGGIGLLIWVIVAWLVVWLIGSLGREARVLRMSLMLIGVAAISALVWYFLKAVTDKEGPEGKKQVDEIDVALATAKTKLAAARQTDKARMGQLPLVICLGPTGSAKTTTLIRSGLDPDLLVGEILRGDAVVATRSINMWYTNRTVFLEAGGRLIAEPVRFTRLVKRLQPERLKAVVTAGQQAPRVALVCLSLEDLLAPGGGEAVMAHARDLRARLLELSQRLGIRLPVYVVFTKADKIPYFVDFVRNFSNEEAREVLGATLPWDSGPAGTYADRTGNRVTSSMSRLANTLCAHRLQFLPRETQPVVAAGAYEFAREFRKLIPLATQFLVDLCKPSQLEVSPILRGFYFTGVRAVVTEEGGGVQAQSMQRQDPLRLDATQAFVPQMHGILQAQPMQMGMVTRKVPQWMFLGRLFRDVLLKDRVALGSTTGGARVNMLRRVLLASAAAVAFLLILGFFTSFVSNRRLQRQVMSAAQGISAASLPTGDVVSLQILIRLDTLRLVTAKLAGWERDGAPLRLRWGLYTGSALYSRLSDIYFGRFDHLMFGPTHDRTMVDLRNLPRQRTDSTNYEAAYNLLKSHLIVTTFPQKSTPEFLAPVLTREWRAGYDVSEERARLGENQFAFYASELPHQNPFVLEPDTFGIEHARSLLRLFEDDEQIYQIMQTRAASEGGAKWFSYADLQAASPVVISPYRVPPAFTRRGYVYMQKAFADIDTFFTGEEWVLGGEPTSERERRDVARRLRLRYRNDFIQHWRRVLSQTHVAPFAGLQDASRKLTALGSNPSPLIALINGVSLNVSVDTALANTVFQPALVVSPADSVKMIGEKADPYLSAVQGLGIALGNVAAAPATEQDAPAQQAKSAVDATRQAAASIQNAFQGTNDSNSVAGEITRLLATEWIGRVDPMLGNVGAKGVNRAGADFCAQWNATLARAPFNPNGVPATVQEVTNLFQQPTGAIWTFYNTTLSRHMSRTPFGFTRNSGSSIKIGERFLNFFTRAAQFSMATFAQEGQAAPKVNFAFKAILPPDVRQVVLVVDGAIKPFTPFRRDELPVNWNANDAQSARVEITIGGNTSQLVGKAGTWSLFHLFSQAKNWSRVTGTKYKAEWTIPHEGKVYLVPFELNLQGSEPIFDPGWLRSISCVSSVASP